MEYVNTLFPHIEATIFALCVFKLSHRERQFIKKDCFFCCCCFFGKTKSMKNNTSPYASVRRNRSAALWSPRGSQLTEMVWGRS